MELKSIHDTFPNLKILASGSSALEITRGSHDLSRRAIVYRMYGMSFREYIGMNRSIYFDSLTLDAIVTGHQQAACAIVEELEKNGLKVLALFKEYLECGYYPYFLEYEDKTQFYMTLDQNIHATLEGDLLVNDEITFEVGGKNKDSSQIKNTENAWLALDNIEIGHGIRIPLWLFGYLY